MLREGSASLMGVDGARGSGYPHGGPEAAAPPPPGSNHHLRPSQVGLIGGAVPQQQGQGAGAPLFDRMMSSGSQVLDPLSASYADLREIMFVESQTARMAELERINVDLERRLEQQAKERMKIEKEVADQKRQWEMRQAEMARDRDEWRAKFEKEVLHVNKLREQVRRLERELHGFLQKKYDYMQQQQQQQQPGGAGLAGPGGALLTPSGASSMGGGGLLMKGPGGQGSSRGGGGGPMAGLIREGSQGSARMMALGLTPRQPSQQLHHVGVEGSSSSAAGGGLTVNPKDVNPGAMREKRAVQSLCDFFGL